VTGKIEYLHMDFGADRSARVGRKDSRQKADALGGFTNTVRTRRTMTGPIEDCHRGD
jgi:hypothetical protein